MKTQKLSISVAEKIVIALEKIGWNIGANFKEKAKSADDLVKTCPNELAKYLVLHNIDFELKEYRLIIDWMLDLSEEYNWALGTESLDEFVKALKNVTNK